MPTVRAFKTAAGSKDMIVASGDFFVTGMAKPYDRLYRVLISLLDGTGNSTPTKFGALAALTNGIKIEHLDSNDAVIHDYTADGTIKQNLDWCRLAGPDGFTGERTFYCVRWSFWKMGAALQLREGEKLNFKIQDNLAGLDVFEAYGHFL